MKPLGLWRLCYRLTGYLLLTVICLPFVILLHARRLHALKMRWIGVYYRGALATWGVKLRAEGKFSKQRPLLVVSNHCSYVDIPVLGSLAPLHFTPKAEIRHWPVIGTLCHLAECIFIDRNPRKTAENMQDLHQAFAAQQMISLFPEGTTNDGTQLLPFRSSYFKLAEGEAIPIQPVTLRYEAHDGSPLSAARLRKVVWIDDDEFFPHLLQFLQQPAITARVICHPVLETPKAPINRKELAQHSHQQIENGLKV